jgi:isopenicillin-N epimerase
VRPAILSHGANSPRRDRSRFLIEFDWTGTFDPTPWLCIPDALRFMGKLLPGGWISLVQRNHELALEARDLLCEALRIDRPAPDEMLGCMAAVPLPDAPQPDPPALDPLQDELLFEHGIEVPIVPWPAPPKRVLRVSAAVYNVRADYERLAQVLAR